MRVDRVLKGRSTTLTPAERAVLDASIREVRRYDARHILVEQGTTVHCSTLLISGLIGRHVNDPNGTQQMVSVQVPGDFVDLHGYALRTLDHDVSALTPVEVALVPHDALWTIQCEHPALARKLWFASLLDAAMHRKWVYRLGQLKANARLAHFFCETNVRLFAVGLSDGSRFALPLTQFDLGEICGMTSVHVNRVLRALRDEGLCTVRNAVVDIHDVPALARLAMFDPGYLYLDAPMAHRFALADALARLAR